MGILEEDFEKYSYLKIQLGFTNERSLNYHFKKIRQLEKFAVQLNQTQLFIEAPFRNQKLLLDLLNTCLPGTKLCIATEITTATEQITTKTVLDWKKNIPNINKRNTVFVIGA